jgi:hypothetical protein
MRHANSRRNRLNRFACVLRRIYKQHPLALVAKN